MSPPGSSFEEHSQSGPPHSQGTQNLSSSLCHSLSLRGVGQGENLGSVGRETVSDQDKLGPRNGRPSGQQALLEGPRM